MRLEEIEVDKILSTDLQRGELDSEKMRSLVGSIKQFGVLEPILVAPTPEGGYQLIAGFRRLIASIQAEKRTIPAIILEPEEINGEYEYLTLTENIEREDLSPIDEARLYEYILSKGISILELAQKVNRSTSYIYQRLELLKLPKEAQERIQEGERVEAVKRSLSYQANAQPSPSPSIPTPSQPTSAGPRKVSCYYCHKEKELGKEIRFIPVCLSCLGEKEDE